VKLDELQRHWNDFGKQDPLWAIMTWPSKRNRGWQLAEFFRTGEDEIQATLDRVAALGLPRPHRRALDFGCGVGRLTQALGSRFESVCGVDIAQSMIELAREYNKHGERCRYFHNTADDLGIFDDESFDFVFTLRVLQHMRPEYSQRYIREFMRLLAPGAVAVFQIPGPAPAPAPAEPLPDAAFRAEIRSEHDAQTMTVGGVLPLTVHVRNASAVAWPSRALSTSVHPLRLGSHWRAAGGAAQDRDDARVVLERDLAPGEEATLAIAVTAPAQPGEYRLELDVVQEGVAWFADRGSSPAGVRVRVASEPWTKRLRRRLGSLRARPEPVMEMYATPREVVVATVEGLGGRVVDVQADLTVEGWSSATYYVQKAPAGS
jgi:ubiquinone/menaquinone biosynthesis C-methylase UbiE